MNQKGQEVKRIKEKDLENIRKYLGEINKIGFLNFINIGVNVGLRISDLAQLSTYLIIYAQIFIQMIMIQLHFLNITKKSC